MEARLGMPGADNARALGCGGSRPWGWLAWLIALAWAAPSGTASAQSTPPATLPNVQQLTPPPPRTDADADARRLPAAPQRPAPALMPPSDGLRLDVSGFHVDGAPPALEPALDELTAPFIGTARRYEDLQAAADAITRRLQALGYYLSYAYIPAQRPAAGRVRIQVLEGRLDRVSLQWAEGIAVDRSVVEAYLDRLRPGQPLRVSEVERVVLLLNDLRGVAARFEFREGREVGTAELVVVATPEAAWQGRVGIDNDGSRYTGTWRVSGQARRASPLGRGDELSVDTQVSTSGGLVFALAGYTLPVGADGLKLGASLSAFRYRFDHDLMPQTVRGHASAATAYAVYPQVRARNLNVFTLASLEHKRFTDRQGPGSTLESRKHSSELRLALSGDWRDDVGGGAASTYDVGGSLGRMGFDGGAPAGSDDSRRIAKLNLDVSRLQNLLVDRALLFAHLRAQQAFKNLDSTQQFRLGGVDGVRAFAPGEGAGDSGQLLTLELRAPLPATWWGRGWGAAVFYDIGRITLRDDTGQRPAGFDNHTTLAGAGVGLNWEPRGDVQARLFVAWATVGQATRDRTERRSPRIQALVSKTF